MKHYQLCVAGLFLFTATFGYAGDLSQYNGTHSVTEYSWCHGPLSQTTPGACSYFGWHQVDLDSIVAFEFSFTDESKFIKIVDTNGNSWGRNLLECVEYPLSPGQCHVTITERPENGYSIHFTDLPPHASQNQSMIMGLNSDEFSIFGPDNALMIFKVSKNH
jgi:hypothetical protein